MKWLVCVAALAACDHASTPAVVPGERIGEVALGTDWASVRAELGDPPNDPTMIGGLGYATGWVNGFDVLLASSDPNALTDDATVIGVGMKHPPADVAAGFGEPDESYAGAEFYPSGAAIERDDGGAIIRVAVVSARGARRAEIASVTPTPGVELDGRLVPVVDMHLHPGNYATMADNGKAFVAGNLPKFLRIYAPELLTTISDPWTPHIGIADQTTLAHVGHAVLFAVYAPQSIGVFSNEALLEILDDPRNMAADGKPWAWGMASIDLSDWNEEKGAARFAALREDLAQHDKLVGIKLAFAHQHVALDNATTRGIYEIARGAGVPILHHTGFSPFPGTATDPHYYDPQYLEAMLVAYPDVQVVLSHVGQGDARSVEHALALAVANQNVWLELSALARPLLVDITGAPVMTAEPQFPAVLAAIRERGLIGRTLFASDGPQYPGAIAAYVGKLVAGMKAAQYSNEEIEAVLAKNFERLFTRTKHRAR